ncbi:MAG: hypothetical protein HY002_15095 [Candidatus Rokubacteria bacterium]|nr:hypothetical protein [Candidatus Rokubacteria bacterium]
MRGWGWVAWVGPALVWGLAAPSAVLAQETLGSRCTATVLNRSAIVNDGGSFEIPNVPTNGLPVRVRITCTDGPTAGGQSSFVVATPNGTVPVGTITPGVVDPPPERLLVNGSSGTVVLVVPVGGTTQLTVTGQFPGGPTRDLTAAGTGTIYRTSNPAIAAVTPDGLVSGVAFGCAIVGPAHEGLIAAIGISVGGAPECNPGAGD